MGSAESFRGRDSSLEITRQRLERTRSTSKVVSAVRIEIDLSLFRGSAQAAKSLCPILCPT